MLIMTMIARLPDALPLAASASDDNQTMGKSLVDYQNQAKLLFRKMNASSPIRGSVETGAYIFHYFIDKEIAYLTMCDKNFSRRTAFSYLEELAQEFFNSYGNKMHSVHRPYSFIEFDTFIQKTKKQYLNNRSTNLTRVSSELQEVQKIMIQNIDDVLQRGDALKSLDDKAQNLRLNSEKYRKNAHNLNLKSTYAKIGAAVLLVVIFLLFMKFYIF